MGLFVDKIRMALALVAIYVFCIIMLPFAIISTIHSGLTRGDWQRHQWSDLWETCKSTTGDIVKFLAL